MRKVGSAIFSACLSGLMAATGADAQAVRSWVSSTGLDTNDCSRANPCRTFGAAIATTKSGGE